MEEKEKLEACLQQILESDPYKLVISRPRSGNSVNKKINILQKKNNYQLERYTRTQVFHENLTRDQVRLQCIIYLSESFSQLNAWSGEQEYSILISKKGRLTWKKRNLQPGEARPFMQEEHNRKKQYLLQEGEQIPPLIDMGIFTKEGRVVASMQDKFRQINRFVELVDDEVKKLPDKKLKVIDFGCGKSYLTFILYYYFTRVRKVEVDMVGLDLKEEVIRNCNRAAQKYGYTGLHFEMGDIGGYKSDEPADMVVTLHACDTATDYALFHAINWKAGMIFSVPCCQHELNQQFQSRHLEALGRYGIIKERISALMTDTIRANILEYCGYKTQILEFVDLENTPKNLLLRGVRQKGAIKSRTQREKADRCLKEVRDLMKEFGFRPTLYQLLVETGQIDEADG